jgi:hypothetical protein
LDDGFVIGPTLEQQLVNFDELTVPEPATIMTLR